VKDRSGREHPYYVASRATEISGLKAVTRENQPDGVIIYAVHKGEEDRIVMVRQYRYTLGDYIYELPAGLVDPGEDYKVTAAREMMEETGLTFRPVEHDACYSEPFFTTIGMTDESCRTVYGEAFGEPSNAYLEESEDIEVVFVNRAQAKEILKSEKVALMAAYLLMNFIHSEDPFWFLK
jgi:ADP-ribose pyrophosphatase